MAVQPLWLQNLDYPARWDRAVFDALWTEGILTGSAFAVNARAVPSMAVDVSAGEAIVQGDDQAFQGKYFCREEAVTANLTIGAAPGSGQRNDLIVLKVNDPNAGGAAGDNAVVVVVPGTPSGSPVDPAVPASALVLARVRVPAGTGVITNSLIDDLRLRAEVRSATPPIGTVSQFAGAVAPDGYLLCDGTAVSQTKYANLYAAIGSTYNTMGGQAVPAAGLFRVPLLTGRVVVGRNASDPEFDTLGETGGSKTVTLDLTTLPTHTHTQAAHNHTQDAHTHVQQAHNHTQDAHNHTQNGHNHTQDGHNHTQDGHGHTSQNSGYHGHTMSDTLDLEIHQHYLDVRSTGSTSHTHQGTATIAAGIQGGGTQTQQTGVAPYELTPDVDGNGIHAHTIDGTTATNQATTATNQATTATNQQTTATNQQTTAINNTTTAVNNPETPLINSTGGGAPHANLQPYAVLNYIIKF